MRPGANYGFLGGQIQYNFLNNEENNWDAAARINFMRLYGPADIRFYVAGIDVVASKKIKLYKEWLSVSPYTYASAVLAHGKEKSSRVNLNNEDQIGFQISGGAEMRVSVIKIAAEYNFAAINSLSFKVGACFNLKPKKEKPVLLKE